MWYVLLVVLPVVFSSACPKLSDPLNSHAGIFRPLNLNENEVALMSQLHATASYHLLMEFVTEKMLDSDLSHSDRKRIEKFLLRMRPPKSVKTFLSEDERDQIRLHHASCRVVESGQIVGEAIQRLVPLERRSMLEYVWHDPQPFMYEYFGLNPVQP